MVTAKNAMDERITVALARSAPWDSGDAWTFAPGEAEMFRRLHAVSATITLSDGRQWTEVLGDKGTGSGTYEVRGYKNIVFLFNDDLAPALLKLGLDIAIEALRKSITTTTK